MDNAKNKPIKIELKPTKGSSGKANIKLYDVNNRGGATMMITKVTDGNFSHVKVLAFKIIEYLLDDI